MSSVRPTVAMEAHSLLFSVLRPPPPPPRSAIHLPSSSSSLRLLPVSAVKSPRGFGPLPSKKSKRRRQRQQLKRGSDEEEEEEEEDEDESDDGGGGGDVAIPQVVTDRMMRRMGLSVGGPLAVGLVFFPFFYYLKVGLKIDVPTWVPLLVSFVFFGTALLGVSYGIVSASWDPAREGSLLGWNEARRNWPVFWESLWGGNDRRRSR